MPITTTPILDLPYINDSLTSPETVWGWLADRVERGIAGQVSISMTAADVSATDTQARNAVIVCTGTPGTTRELELPGAIAKPFLVVNKSDSDVSVITDAPGDAIIVAPGQASILLNDGTDIILINAPNSTSVYMDAYDAGPQSISAGNIEFGGTSSGSGITHSNSVNTDQFTIQETGRYSVGINCTVAQQVSGDMQLSLCINTAAVWSAAVPMTTNPAIAQMHAHLNLTAGDIITAYFATSGPTEDVISKRFFITKL